MKSLRRSSSHEAMSRRSWGLGPHVCQPHYLASSIEGATFPSANDKDLFSLKVEKGQYHKPCVIEACDSGMRGEMLTSFLNLSY